MILVLETSVGTFELREEVVSVFEVADFGAPAGINASVLTAKGQIIAARGAADPVAIPAPSTTGMVLQADPATQSGWKADFLSVTVEDSANRLINGGFLLAQRQAPGTLTAVADDKYGPDRWRSVRENADLQYIRVDGSADASLTSNYYGQYKKITNTGKFLTCQIIEGRDTIPLHGQTLTFQLKMKASSAKTIQIAVIELAAAGSADTMPASIVSAWNADTSNPTLGANLAVVDSVQSCAVTTAWQSFYVTAQVPSDSKNIMVAIWTDSGFAANDTLSLAEAALYVGTQTRTWSPRHSQQEIALCQRYYCKSYVEFRPPGYANTAGPAFGIAVSTSVVRPMMRLPVTMRALPAVVYYSATGTANKVSNAAGADVGTTVTGTASTDALDLVQDSATGFTASAVYTFHFTADAEL